MFDKDLVLKIGLGEFEGRTYKYLYVDLDINGEKMEIKLKPYSTLEKKLIIRTIEGKEGK